VGDVEREIDPPEQCFLRSRGSNLFYSRVFPCDRDQVSRMSSAFVNSTTRFRRCHKTFDSVWGFARKIFDRSGFSRQPVFRSPFDSRLLREFSTLGSVSRVCIGTAVPDPSVRKFFTPPPPPSIGGRLPRPLKRFHRVFRS